MKTIAKLITTSPSVEPGWEWSPPIGVAVGVGVLPAGRELARAWREAVGFGAADGCAYPGVEGDNDITNARTVARISSGNSTRNKPLSMRGSVYHVVKNEIAPFMCFFLAFEV